MLKMALVVLILALAVGAAYAKPAGTIDQFGVGAYFLTDKTPAFDPNTGWAVNYFHLAERNWYTSVEVGHYSATIHFTPVAGEASSAAADVTTWLATIGRAIRTSDGKTYVGLGVGYLVDDDVNLGHGVRFETDGRIGWEIVAGTVRAPLGVQVRYHDGRMAPNRGVTASLTYSW